MEQSRGLGVHRDTICGSMGQDTAGYRSCGAGYEGQGDRKQQGIWECIGACFGDPWGRMDRGTRGIGHRGVQAMLMWEKKGMRCC